MLTIRLRRKGKKNQPFFRVVLIDKRRSAKGGNAVEVLGNVDPLTKRKVLHKDRILYWISKGAKASDTVNNLLISEKIIEGKKIHVSKLSKKKQEEIAKAKQEAAAKAEAEAKAAAAPAATEAPKEEKPAEPASLETPKEPDSAEATDAQGEPKPETPAQ